MHSDDQVSKKLIAADYSDERVKMQRENAVQRNFPPAGCAASHFKPHPGGCLGPAALLCRRGAACFGDPCMYALAVAPGKKLINTRIADIAHAMKISEVPQDDVKTLNGLKKALYALDDQGCYTKTATRGWEAEEVVLNQVIGDFAEKAVETASRVRNNETSPIEYFMYRNWMDSTTLAQAMGLYLWQVKRHFKPSIFKNLDDRTLAEYAALFRISVDALKHFHGED